MLLRLDKRSGAPIYQQLVQQLKAQIVGGQLSLGEQLTSVRELAGQLRVNPMTVSKAYGLLEVEGLVERKRGIGLFVRDVTRDPALRREAAEGPLRQAALRAHQLGLSEQEALAMFAKLYRELSREESEHAESRPNTEPV